jgi:hypothetical protein
MDTPRSSDPRPPDPPTREIGSLGKTAVVIYATLFLLALTIPESLVSWIRDMKSIEIQEVLLPAAQALQRIGEASGMSVPYARAREAFLALTSGQANN